MTTTEAPTILMVEPRFIAPHPDNARKKLRDIPALKASIEKLGVLVPLIVTPLDDLHVADYRLVAGQRRWTAASEAGIAVPVIVRADLKDVPLDQALAMLSENESRDNLTGAELARAHQHAFDLGATDEDIAGATGLPKADVAKVRTLTASPVAVGLAERHGEIDLEKALVLAEFEDDTDTLKALTQIAVKRPYQWEHAVARSRRERKEAAEQTKRLKPYIDAGVKMLTDAELAKTRNGYRSGIVNPSPRLPINRLANAKGNRLTAAQHKSCPGRSVAAAFQWDWEDPTVTEFCEDPKAHDHKPLKGKTPPAGTTSNGAKPANVGDLEKASAERRKVIANNKAMDTANGVREQFIIDLLKRKTVPKGTERFVAEHFALSDSWMRLDPPDSTCLRFMGLDQQSGKADAAKARMLKSLPDRRVVMVPLMLIAATIESDTDKTSWRQPSTTRARWFNYLKAVGYTLSDVEALCLKAK